VLLSIFSYTCFGQTPDSIPHHFDANAQGTIEFEYQNAHDSMGLITEFVTLLPPVYLESDPAKFIGNGKLFLNLKIMMPLKVNYWVYFLNPKLVRNSSDTLLYSENQSTSCFLMPGDTLHISVDFSRRESVPECFKYSSSWSQLSEYFKSKEITFPNVDFKRLKAIASNTAADYQSFIGIIDSITQVEMKFLKTYTLKFHLPKWFVDYQRCDLTYLSYCMRLTQPSMMQMRGIAKPIPKGYYSFLKDAKLNNQNGIFANNYFSFLNFYFANSQPPFSESNYNDTSFLINRLKNLVSYSTKNLDENISDIFLAYMLDTEILRGYVSKRTYTLYTDSIHSESLKKYLEKRYINKYVLKEGDQAPSFYLKDEQNKNVTLRSFEGNIVYITFWFTGCKPCIKEIPDENHLVEVFKDENVKIVSICMNSSEESWRECIAKFGIKSTALICKGNWEKILREKYDINAFPHHAIIDKHGKILVNKWQKSSGEAEDEIRKWLVR
jgi:peroxiredoxin